MSFSRTGVLENALTWTNLIEVGNLAGDPSIKIMRKGNDDLAHLVEVNVLPLNKFSHRIMLLT